MLSTADGPALKRPCQYRCGERGQSAKGHEMGTEIKSWQIVDGKLTSIETTRRSEGRTEPYDLAGR